MTLQLLSFKQAAIELYGPSKTQEEENDKYIKLLCLTDKGLKTHRVFEVASDGKQTRRVKVDKVDILKLKESL